MNFRKLIYLFIYLLFHLCFAQAVPEDVSYSSVNHDSKSQYDIKLRGPDVALDNALGLDAAARDISAGSRPARTATGGFVRKVLVLLSMVAFVGNLFFMVNVFWFRE
jgi:hypothetical protein